MGNEEKQTDRRLADPWREHVDERLGNMDKKIDANTEVTVETKQRVDEVHEILMTIKGALKAMGWLARGAKWVSAFLGLVSAIWLLWYQATHSGDVPVSKIDLPK
jgi:hypothetical protein